jgi:UDPglucose--hexose-1-phosphate uridylyltransferase
MGPVYPGLDHGGVEPAEPAADAEGLVSVLPLVRERAGLRRDGDFPALRQDPPEPDGVATDFFKTRPNYGKCEVILYSPEHTVTLPELSDAHMRRLVDLWCERFSAMRADPKIKYIFIFENRGDVVGVTMPHPHGQIYGYPFLPKKLELETRSAKEYYESTGRCLFCDHLKNEIKEKKRILFQNEFFTVFLPFFTAYPYGVYIQSNAHRQYLTDFTDEERDAFGITVRDTAGMLDSLFGYKFPYMMCMHNAPVNSGDYSKDFHFHVEFYPPMRSAEKQKFNASSETGAWAACNPTCPEDTAEELRAAYARFIKEKGHQS